MSPKVYKTIIISLLSIFIVLVALIGYLLWSYLNVEKDQKAKENETISSISEKETVEHESNVTESNPIDESINESNVSSEYIEKQDRSMKETENYTNNKKIEPISGVMYKGVVYNKISDLPKLDENASKSEVDEYNSVSSNLTPTLGTPIHFEDRTRIINISDAPELTIEYVSTEIKEYELENLGEGAEISFLISNLSNDYNLDVRIQELYVDGHYIENPYHSMRAKIGHGDTFQNESINVSSVTPFADNPLGYFPAFKESIVGQFIIEYSQVEKNPFQDVPTTIRIPFVIDLRSII